MHCKDRIHETLNEQSQTEATPTYLPWQQTQARTHTHMHTHTSHTQTHTHAHSHLTFLAFCGGVSFMTTINEIQIYIFLASAAAIGTHALTLVFTLILTLTLTRVCVRVCCLINADTHMLTFFCVNLRDLISREGLQVVSTV